MAKYKDAPDVELIVSLKQHVAYENKYLQSAPGMSCCGARFDDTVELVLSSTTSGLTMTLNPYTEPTTKIQIFLYNTIHHLDGLFDAHFFDKDDMIETLADSTMNTIIHESLHKTIRETVSIQPIKNEELAVEFLALHSLGDSVKCKRKLFCDKQKKLFKRLSQAYKKAKRDNNGWLLHNGATAYL